LRQDVLFLNQSKPAALAIAIGRGGQTDRERKKIRGKIGRFWANEKKGRSV
jgi:hypothetical protein